MSEAAPYSGPYPARVSPNVAPRPRVVPAPYDRSCVSPHPRFPRLFKSYVRRQRIEFPTGQIYARKPSLPPFCLAVRMRFWRTLPSAPISLQKSVMTCDTWWRWVSVVRYDRSAVRGGGRVDAGRVSGTRRRVPKRGGI